MTEQVKDYSIERELEVYKSIMEALTQSMFLLDKHKNVIDSHLEVTITKISGERMLSQVHAITDIVLKLKDIENKKHNELLMELTAGGIVSWKTPAGSGPYKL